MPRSPATCHPDRPSMAYGLCGQCRERQRRETEGDRMREMSRIRHDAKRELLVFKAIAQIEARSKVRP